MLRNHRTTGFTIVELLVVITVVAMLMSMLLPALTTARIVAQSIKCRANLRGLVNATILYTNEYKNQIPSSAIDGDYESLSSLMSGGQFQATYYTTPRWGNVAPTYAWESEALFCPAETVRTIAWPSTGYMYEFTTLTSSNGVRLPMYSKVNAADVRQGFIGARAVRTHYAANSVNTGSTQTTNYPFTPLMWYDNSQLTWRYDGILNKMDNMTTPSDTFMEGDCWSTLSGGPVFRHPNSAMNMNFADGHVIDMKASDIHMLNNGTYATIDDVRQFMQH